jgi:hypothetical protein
VNMGVQLQNDLCDDHGYELLELAKMLVNGSECAYAEAINRAPGRQRFEALPLKS